MQLYDITVLFYNLFPNHSFASFFTLITSWDVFSEYFTLTRISISWVATYNQFRSHWHRKLALSQNASFCFGVESHLPSSFQIMQFGEIFSAVLHCESGATHINACLSTAVVFNLCITYAPVSLSREPDSLLLQKPVQDLQLQRKWAVNQEDVICNHEWSYPHFLKTKSCLLQIPSMCSSPH